MSFQCQESTCRMHTESTCRIHTDARILNQSRNPTSLINCSTNYMQHHNSRKRFSTHYVLVTDWMLDRDPQEEVFKAFRLFDDDDSGKISLRNLRRVARELGENMTDEELRAMIDEFDKDGDGESESFKICRFFCLNII